jgi:TatD DNase family protein
VKRPVIVHCRDAAADVAEILRTEKAGECGGVLHSFSEDVPFAQHCLDLGFYISFSGIVTFKRTLPLHDAVRMVPADRLLLETDAPYLAPAPHRGRRNEPAHVVETARFVAGLRGEAPERVGAASAENFERLFGGRIWP